MRTIADRIRARREELQMTQDELAQRLGYKSRSSINKIEKDSRNLTQSKIKAIADALETTPAYIMGWEEPNKKDEARRQLLEEWDRASPEQQQMMLNILRAVKNGGK